MPRMFTMQLIDTDLNLLKTLDALIETRSVTRAAKILGLTQPATSHALARLRSVLNDQLLVREGAGHVLTERALALRDPVREALSKAGSVLTGVVAPPLRELRREFKLTHADYTELMLLPPLVERLSAQAPNVSVTSRPGEANAMDALQSGSDIWIGPFVDDRPGLFVQKLWSDTYLCAVRKGHPVAKGKMTLEKFATLKHVQIAPGGKPGGPLDDAMLERGYVRQVAMRVPHFLVAPLLVERSDLVLAAPRRLLEKFSSLTQQLHIFESPIPIRGFTLNQAWLARHHEDPVHRWLRSEIRRCSPT
ncbi:MAG: LysR family transcriptional regulator [Archangium sp.]